MTAVITLDEAKERIRRLAEERPDYVYEPVQDEDDDYPRCLYFTPDGAPSCIIGHAFEDELRAAGVDFTTQGTVSALAWPGHKAAELPLTEGALQFLGEVQRQQDRGARWGVAYRRGLTHVGAE